MPPSRATTYGALFDACEKKRAETSSDAKNRSDKHLKNERDAQTKEATDGASRDKKWMSARKGDNLNLYKAWNQAAPEKI